MSVFWNKRAKNLSPYIPGEQPRDRNFIKLNTNENPYPPSPKVIEAIAKAACGDLRLYPDPSCESFREAVAARCGVKPGQVFAGNGSDEVLGFAFGAFFASSADNAAPMLFPDVTYNFYPVYANLWDIPFRAVPLRGDFSVSVRDYMLPSGGAALPNPNPPIGMALPLKKILALAKRLEEQEKVLLLDEAYIAFAAQNGAQSAVNCIDSHPNLLVSHTLSKSASLAGLRVGYAVGSEPLIEGLCRIRDSLNSYTLDRLALAGAEAAVSDAAYYDEINRKVVATRERVAQALRGLGFAVLPSAANFLLARTPAISGADLHRELRRRGILARHFGNARIADFLRVSIGTDAQMDAFLGACEEIISGRQRASLGAGG